MTKTHDSMLAHMTRKLQNDVEHGQAQLDKWAKSFAENATYALKWAADTFQIAAEVELAKEVLDGIEFFKSNKPDATSEEVFDVVVKKLREDVLLKAKYVPSSTSATSNLVEAHQTAAKAKLLSNLSWL